MSSHEETKPAGKIEFYGGYEVYDENGVDLTLLRGNLGRTVDERLAWSAGASVFAQELAEAGRRLYKGPQPPHPITPVINAKAILLLLAKQRVEYIVIGGLAMVIHGSAHITMDLDLCCRATPANLRAVARALTPLHPRRAEPAQEPFDFGEGMLDARSNLALVTDSGPVDLFGEVGGLGSYDDVLAVSETVGIGGFEVRVLSVEGLIAAKRAVNRLQGQNHLLELEALKKLRDAGPQGA